MASACVLTPTNRFCFTCEKIVRKAIFAFSNGHEVDETLERLCTHAEGHQSEARIRKMTMERYENVAYSDYVGPVVEVGVAQYEETGE